MEVVGDDWMLRSRAVLVLPCDLHDELSLPSRANKDQIANIHLIPERVQASSPSTAVGVCRVVLSDQFRDDGVGHRRDLVQISNVPPPNRHKPFAAKQLGRVFGVCVMGYQSPVSHLDLHHKADNVQVSTWGIHTS
jgi:hypothetical protein